MHALPLALLYCVLLGLASLSGGWIPRLIQLTHRRMQIAISFVAGVMLGIGLLHLLPHSFFELKSIDKTVLWAMGGFLTLFFLERFFHFHHHDSPVEVEIQQCEAQGHDHSHCDHDHDHVGPHDVDHPSVGNFSWGGAALGMTLHSLIDGVALAAAISAEQHGDQAVALAGLGTFLAVFLHKPFDSLTIYTLMSAAGWSSKARNTVNTVYALVAPLGVALFFLGVSNSDSHHQFLGSILGFAAGAFLCIATSDLLPELQFHRHDRVPLSISLVLGIVLAWCIMLVETSGHDHHSHDAESSNSSDHRGHAHDHGHDHSGHSH